MKKLSLKQRSYQRRKNLLAMRELKARTPRRPKRPIKRNLVGSEEGVIRAPHHFVIYSSKPNGSGSDIDSFFEFLYKVRASNSSELRIDFSDVRRMVVDAALLFKAELSRLIQVSGVKITAVPPRSDRTKQVLKQTGIDKLLGLTIDGAPSREDVVHWRVAEGPRSYVDPNALAAIMADIESVTGMESHPVYQGIIESMANCVEHAYKAHPDVKRPMPTDPGWWVFQQVRDETLWVVVCDLGIGVRRSLPLTLAGEQGLLRKIMHFARKARGEDNRALLAAMEYGRSSTGQLQRGKGMRNAHKVVDDMGAGRFFAVSNQGCYVYHKSAGQSKGGHRTVKLRHSINGTLLGWMLPLKRTSQESLT